MLARHLRNRYISSTGNLLQDKSNAFFPSSARREASQQYLFQAYVFVKSNQITCPFASPDSDAISSAIAGIYYHRNLHLMMKLEKSPGYPAGPVLVVPLWLSCFDNMQFQEKKERIDLQSTALICISKAIQSGEKWGGRLEEKKAGIKLLPNWWDEERNFGWARLFPAQQNYITPSASQTYNTVPSHKVSIWSFVLQNFTTDFTC